MENQEMKRLSISREVPVVGSYDVIVCGAVPPASWLPWPRPGRERAWR